ncbi:hypothetical protein F0L74_03775 [Chitinophaga agrisoli]|uniref:Uncharacterized protein n=1 Tax=Chitinophaga agrisoli TaxID=2607653 RepID=A0A5B2W302_9BACT|nr:hypothetical protein [Chitinophaga agrisoli]KAA2245090.1 hypothetical protein F0L74_03775 [Chitinophaga agrisoli]
MKYAILVLLSALIGAGCFLPAAKPNVAADSTIVTPVPVEEQAKGTYTGDFAGAPIYITINYANGQHVAGYDIHKGLRRNLHGTLQQTANGWTMALSEPGDHPFDGRFQLAFDTGFHHATGKWAPQTRGTLQEKTFTLHKPDTDSDPVAGNIFSGDHCDIFFETDGNCTLNYYERINDSTFAPQLNTLRGSWKNNGNNKITVDWQPNERFGKRNSTFDATFDADDKGFCTGIVGEGFDFSAVL